MLTGESGRTTYMTDKRMAELFQRQAAHWRAQVQAQKDAAEKTRPIWRPGLSRYHSRGARKCQK